ncbi:MAG: glycerol kinase GlpK [Pseudomonadota bacterium]
MSAKYILSIDQGTTSSRALIFDSQLQRIGAAQMEFPQHFPASGWVEHNPDDIWDSVLSVCKGAIADASVSPADIAGIGITNQRETTLVWDRLTGEVVYNAIVWQDRRTAERCARLSEQGLDEAVKAKTGLRLDPYFSGTKLAWILDDVPGVRERAERGELLFGTIDSYLMFKLSGGRIHKTDATNASRTLLFNIHDQCWDEELLQALSIPAQMLPEVCDCAADFGSTDSDLLGAAIPIAGVAGDQQAALFGQACFEPGMVKSTYGTGCFVIANTGANALVSDNQLLTTVASRLNGVVQYGLEGSIFVAGSAVQWLRDGLGIIESAAETSEICKRRGLVEELIVVPAFTGLGAPYWDPNARGAIFGLTRDSDRDTIVTATLQAVAYQTADLIRCMAEDGIEPKRLRVDGGMVANDWFVQFLADMIDVQVQRPLFAESTVLGAAALAGLQAGMFSSLDELEKVWQLDANFDAQFAPEKREGLYAGWLDAVRRIR